LGRALNRASAWNGPPVTILGLGLALLAGLLIARLDLLSGVMFVGLALLGVGTAIEPLVGLGGLLFLGPLWAYLRAEVPQVPAQIAQLFVVLALGVWLAQGLARREVRVRSSPLLVPLAVFLGAALLSLWDAVELAVYGIPEFIKWVQIGILFLFVGDHLTPRRLGWLMGALLVTGLFQASVGVWQFGLRGEGPAHFGILGGDFYRAYGTFEQPNPYAGYLGITLPLALGPLMAAVYGWVVNWYQSRSGRSQPDQKSASLAAWQFLFLGGVAGVMLAGLGMSWSRGAWLGFGAAAAAMALALPQDARWGVLLVGLLVVGGLGLYVTGLLPSSVATRLTGFAQYVRFEDVRGVGINDANYAVLERLAHWQAGLEMLRHNLWTGVGLGCYEPAYGSFALINWPIALGHAHNTYLNMAAETGLIGCCAYLLLWGVVFWQTWRATRRAGGPWRGVAIGLLGTWTHLTVHNFLDNLYVNNVHLHIGVMLGMLAFVIRQTERQVEGQDQPKMNQL
jgi:O-antigen ligase